MTPRPFVVVVADLLRQPGLRRQVSVSAPVDDLGISTAQVVEGSDVTVDAMVEAIGDHTLTVTGAVAATWVGECRRCLAEVEGALVTNVQEVFDAVPIEGETYPLHGDHIDLEPMVRDAILLGLPLAPLCRDACAGPEPQGHPLGEPADGAGDDRWAALRDLKFE